MKHEQLELFPSLTNRAIYPGDRLRSYLDHAIEAWRIKGKEAQTKKDKLVSACYVDAFQSVRVSMLGEPLPVKQEAE